MQLEGMWLPRWRSDTEAHIHFVKRVLYSGQSKYQRVEIVELEGYGKCLVLDGIHQSAEADEFIYQEAIVHPALFMHPDPRHVLVIGAGAGNVLREVLKHPQVQEATMVDIDELVVSACREHLHWEAGAYEDPRTTLIIADGTVFLDSTTDRYDCIIVDSTTAREGSIAYNLYGQHFYETVYTRLNEGGILCGLQSNANILYLDAHRTIRRMLEEVFESVQTYTANCPFYAISYAFALAVKKPSTKMDFSVAPVERIQPIRHKLRFYDEITHLHMFSLPRHIRAAIASDKAVIKQEHLIRH